MVSILYVEDDMLVVEFMITLLTYGHQIKIDPAATVAVAIKKLLKETYDAIILDVHIPCGSTSGLPKEIDKELADREAGGYKLLKILRSGVLTVLSDTNDFERIPVMLATGYLETEHIREYKNVTFVGKFFDPASVAAITEVTTASRHVQQPPTAYLSALIQALGDRNRHWIVRASAASALGDLGDTTAVPTLIKALCDRKRPVEQNAAHALRQIGKPAIPALIHALSDENLEVRLCAISTLGDLGDTTAVPALIEALKDGGFFVRASAASALGEIGTPEARKACKKFKREDKKRRKET